MKYLFLVLFPVLLFGQSAIDIGSNSCGDCGSYYGTNTTYVFIDNPANNTGTIDSVTIRLRLAKTADTLYVGTGTFSGNTYTPRDNSYCLVTGATDAVVKVKLASSIDVVTGDYLAVYTSTGEAVQAKRSTDHSGLGLMYITGNKLVTGAAGFNVATLATERAHVYGVGYTTTITAPTGLSPANTATDISVTPTLTWNVQADADSFYVKLSKSADLSSAIVDTAIKSNSLAVSLDYITQYYWGVAAKIPTDTTWSDTISFTTKKLATPTNRIPIANATLVDSATTFSWAANAEADSFYLQIGDSALSSLVLDTAIVANSLLYTLVNDSSYWWSIAAKNSLDTSAWADTTKFTTGRRSLSEVNKRPGFSGWTHR